MIEALLSPMGWGSPVQMGIFLVCIGILMVCLGAFIWLLSKAKVLK